MEYLNAEEIQQGIKGSLFTYEIEIHKILSSTNDYGKGTLKQLGKTVSIILAEEQTAGRGRQGKVWEGSKNQDIFMSMVFAPKIKSEKISMITLVVALSIYKVLERKVDKEHKLGIKWPNDLILCGKKICGILCEYLLYEDKNNKLIIGIGLNVNRRLFSDENNIASSLYLMEGKEFDRNILVAELLCEFEHYYRIFLRTQDFSNLMNEYNLSLLHMEKEVRLIGSDVERGICHGVNADGMLLIKEPLKQEIKPIFFGEISLRSLKDYC